MVIPLEEIMIIGLFPLLTQKKEIFTLIRIYNIDDDGNWTLRPKTGILIAPGEISSIEFIRPSTIKEETQK